VAIIHLVIFLQIKVSDFALVIQKLGALRSCGSASRIDEIAWKYVESVSESLNWKKTDINEAKKQLYKRHLIQRLEEKNACYKIHPLVRKFLQENLAESEKTDNFKQAFASTFVKFAQKMTKLPNRQDDDF
jgi:predicted transcriptional regulator